MPYKCKGECNRDVFRRIYDISKGLPPTIKNRLDKKKCRRCGIWMIIDSTLCFCCGQKLTKRVAKATKANRQWHHNYPTFEALNMIPAYVEKTMNRINQ